MRSYNAMLGSSRLVTARELERMPSDARFELWTGRLVPVNAPAPFHALVVIRFGSLLYQHVNTYQLGAVMAGCGYLLHTNPDTVLGPDVSFIRRERLDGAPAGGYWKGPPDLAVEILSPSERPGQVRRKVAEYLLRGTPMVLVIDTRRQAVSIYRPGETTLTLTREATLDLSGIVEGFTCRVARIFE